MITSANPANNLALDANSLADLKLQARQDPKTALHAAARQFEAVFMQMMLKSMRDTVDQDGVFDSDQTRQFTSMLDQQLAQNLAGKGLGIADVLIKQLQPQLPPTAANAAAASPSPTADAAATQKTSGKQKPGDFVNRLWPHAAAASRATGIAPSFMIGHAALESGWGKAEIRGANGEPSYNLFGVKAGRNWKGAVVEATTTEYVNGVAQKRVEKFRAYGSYEEAFTDYANLLSRNPRYAAVIDNGNDPARFAVSLQQAGYATDPMYAEKLNRILQGSALRQAMIG